MAQLDNFSRFFQTPEILEQGKETFGVWVQPQYLKERPDEENISIFRVTTQTEGRPDLIANELYGSPMLDWVLIAFNKVRDPLNWPKAGDAIEYPLDIIVFPQIN